jgi:DNA recombination protein RmuC
MFEAQTIGLILLAMSLGALLGALGLHLWRRGNELRLNSEISVLRAQLKSQETLAAERSQTLIQAEERLAASFAELANKSLSRNSESFLRLAKESLGKHEERAKADLTERQRSVEELVKPIQEALNKTHKQIGDIEKSRHEAYGGIKAQLENMAISQEALQTHTRNLVTALRRPEVRGQWGELTLRRIAELAGMVEHCDFSQQVHTETDTGAIRPDMVIHLPDRGEVVVDVKTPLDAYLAAIEAPDEQARKAALQRHARNVGDRIRELAGKAYWSQFESSPEFVILFIPGDQFLSAALAEKPELLEDAMRQKVIIATPTSLVALLKAIAYGWRQLALAENAEEIRRLAQDLHGRLTSFTAHMARLGKQLEGSVKAYNSAVGSLERKVLPGARKFTELGVRGKKSLDQLTEIDSMTREVEDLSGQTEAGEESAKISAAEVSKSESDDSSQTH